MGLPFNRVYLMSSVFPLPYRSCGTELCDRIVQIARRDRKPGKMQKQRNEWCDEFSAGSPAITRADSALGPEALRPRLATGLPISMRLTISVSACAAQAVFAPQAVSVLRQVV